jgi:hypothetical protein
MGLKVPFWQFFREADMALFFFENTVASALKNCISREINCVSKLENPFSNYFLPFLNPKKIVLI